MKHNGDLVSVIIPTFNRKGMLIECIDSVLKSTYKNIEIIVSDDASSDGTREAVAKYKRLENFKYLRNKKESLLSVTINKAIFASSGEYIFILDDDNVIDKNCISSLVSSFAKFKDAGIVGPIAFYKSHPDIIMHAGEKKSLFMRRHVFIHMNEKWDRQIKLGDELDTFGNAFMFKREAAEKAGLWDTIVPFIGEDENFECRVRKHGYKIIINPNAKVYHNRIISTSGWEGRINPMRMYNVLHNKIINEYRYDSLIGRLTFTISLPIYIGFYIRLIQKCYDQYGRMNNLSSLLIGVLKGFSDIINNRSDIKYLDMHLQKF